MIVALALAATFIAPPFVRQWTVLTSENVHLLDVRAGKIWYADRTGVGLLDEASGKTLWKRSVSRYVTASASDAKRIYAAAANKVFTIDRTSGAVKGLKTAVGNVRGLAAADGRLFSIQESGALLAIDVASGKVVWKQSLSKAGWVVGLMVSGRFLYVGAEDARACFDTGTGKRRWRSPDKYASEMPIVLGQKILVQERGGVALQDLATGKVAWRSPHQFEKVGLTGPVLIGEEDASIIGLDAKTGKLLWSKPGGEEGFSSGDGPANVASAAGVWVRSGDWLRCFDAAGAVKWETKPPFLRGPQFADGQTLISVEPSRILGYRHGTLPPLPTNSEGRRALAVRLVDEFEKLDEHERGRIATLRDDAFAPFLAKVVSWMRAEDADGETPRSPEYYDLIQDAGPFLAKMFETKDTAAVLAALRELGLKSEWRAELESLLGAKGDQRLYIPALIESIEAGVTSGGPWGATTVEIVARSKEPDAVRFMLRALADPKATPALRQAAFRHLAGTGGEAGVAAVRATWPAAGPRKPWTDFAKPGKDAVTKKDAQGRTWTLFTSGILGHVGDRFMVGADGKPIYLGFYRGSVFRTKAPITVRGRPVDEMIAKDWIKVFPDDPLIRKDRDGDGLTDLVEARLGTDPGRADADGDGLADAVDPCPNAAPRPRGDREKIIAACVAARFFGEDEEAPALISVEGVAPFELYGYSQTLMWGPGFESSPLGQVYGGGMNLIGFGPPSEEAKETFVFGPGGDTATTLISRYSGGLNGDGTQVWLKKIGDDWFVTDMKLRYVS